MKYKDAESLKKNRDFQLVYKTGTSYVNKYLVMYARENQLGKNRIGISVSKKVGNSVVRHRLCRLVRESYRLHEDVFRRGFDIVVVARVSAKERTFREIESAFLHLGRLHHLVEKEEHESRFYQKYISPLKSTKCPYFPSCSQYGLEAIEKYGAFKGSLLALWRILRCNPFSKGGVDPVP